MQLLQGEPLCKHTTFRIGGAAAYYAVPQSTEEIQECLTFAKKKSLPYFILGRGSNVLFSDDGYEGVVIEIGAGMQEMRFPEENQIEVQAGVMLSALASEAAKKSLMGLEFAAGIPGTVGGAVVMNAGAYGGEIKQCIVSANVLDETGRIQKLSREELNLGYRSSIIQKEKWIVLDALFACQPGETDRIRARMKELAAQRREKQPLEYASAGSTFKRPKGYFAGKLIEDAGLRGYRVGDAQVSEKHCGFVINRGNASARDVQRVIEDVQEKVYEVSGVMLEPEVRIISLKRE